MRHIYLVLITLLVIGTVSCKDDNKGPNHPWPPGEGESDIRPEKTDVYFEAKEDTVIVNTENEYWTLILHDADGRWIEPTNYTKDTLTESWTKIVALEPIQHVSEGGRISITSKRVKIIVFDNTTGQERKRNILLGKENSGAVINITQSGK